MKGDKVKSRLERTLATITAEQLPCAERDLRLLQLYAPKQVDELDEQYRNAVNRLLPRGPGKDAYHFLRHTIIRLEEDRKGMLDILTQAEHDVDTMNPHEFHQKHKRLKEDFDARRHHDKESALLQMRLAEEQLKELDGTPYEQFKPLYDQRLQPLREFYKNN